MGVDSRNPRLLSTMAFAMIISLIGVLKQADAATVSTQAPNTTSTPRVLQLPSFVGLVSCAPFTVLVAPSEAGSNASILLEAPPDVSSAIAMGVVSCVSIGSRYAAAVD